MTLNANRMLEGLPAEIDRSLSATKCNRREIARQRPADKRAVAAKSGTTNLVVLPVLPARISRHIDWYAKNRDLPPPIASFLDTHWRAYTLRSFAIHGEDSEVCGEANKTMKDLAWSVRPKRNFLSRRRLIALIPQLYQQLYVGLESLGLDASEHDAFFSDLAKLHQGALNP